MNKEQEILDGYPVKRGSETNLLKLPDIAAQREQLTQLKRMIDLNKRLTKQLRKAARPRWRR